MLNKLILVFILSSVLATACATEKLVVCYYASWATYRSSLGKYDASNIDATLCTHLIYSFIGLLDDGTVRVLDPELDITKDGFKKFTDLRNVNPSAKIMVAMGGWNEGSLNYSKVVTDATLRAKLADNIVEFVKKYGFDGFDLDWEYPAKRGGLASDKKNLVLFLQELNKKLKKYGFILSIAASPTQSAAQTSYDISEIAKNVDFINLMTYEFHGTFDQDRKVGHNTPLRAAKKETGAQKQLNIDYCVKYWISQGAPAEKLILGTAFSGKSYTLADPNQVGRGAPFSGPGEAGLYTQANGTLAYYEICDLIKNKKWRVLFDKEQRVPYAYSGNQIVGFDNVKSLKEKAEYANRMNLGGAMMWSMDTDDFTGKCGEKNPLLNTLNRVLRNPQ